MANTSARSFSRIKQRHEGSNIDRIELDVGWARSAEAVVMLRRARHRERMHIHLSGRRRLATGSERVLQVMAGGEWNAGWFGDGSCVELVESGSSVVWCRGVVCSLSARRRVNQAEGGYRGCCSLVVLGNGTIHVKHFSRPFD